MSRVIELIPRLSEKTYGLSEKGVYVVDVPKNANKLELKLAIESKFEVNVVSVNVVNVKGKAKRTISKKGRAVSNGRDKDVKKAYFTLAEGQSLPFFAAVEEEEERAEKLQAEISKQQEKETAKEDRPKRRTKRGTKKESEE